MLIGLFRIKGDLIGVNVHEIGLFNFNLKKFAGDIYQTYHVMLMISALFLEQKYLIIRV